MLMEDCLFISTTTLVALMAGLFFCFSFAINGSLHRLTDREYVKTMQLIDTIIQNPTFLFAFMAPLVLLPILTFGYSSAGAPAYWYLFGATVAYIFGPFGVTVAGNIPLNRRLHTVSLDSDKAVAEARKWYEAPWNRLHTVRMLFSILALVLLLIGLVKQVSV